MLEQLELFEQWEEYLDDSETGVCSDCKEHSCPVYQRNVYNGELADPVSDCCGSGIWLP
jgi:hypothetical protein